MHLYDHIFSILEATLTTDRGIKIGKSTEGRTITGFIFGSGAKKISLIAGNHADEPIGPLLLKKLVSYLSVLDKNHELLINYRWYIVPHTNPDGEHRNRKWYTYKDTETNLPKYLQHVIRELPGKDLEFGFPIQGKIESLRPENSAIYNFWKKEGTSFDLHVSLHGMRATYGPWFLIDKDWIDRTKKLRTKCAARTKALGYDLFDLDRRGEKGFQRIEEGFCTRPDSQEMRKHFMALDDSDTAQKFHASSMESIRSLGGDCLTLVTEMPLFLFPKKEREMNWPDPYLQKWSEQFAIWKLKLASGELTSTQCIQEAIKMGVVAMPWKDQMRLQWQLVVAGLETL